MRSSLQKEIDVWLGNDNTIPEPSRLLTNPPNPIKDLPFFTVVDNMIAYNMQRRNEMAAHLVQSGMSPVHFAMEFCTVKCDVGRRTGKTEYVKQRADQYSLVIVPNKQMVKGYPPNIIVKSIGELTGQNSVRFGRTKPRTIYIEEPQMVFQTMRQHELYYRLVDDTIDQTFVLLGA